MLLGTGRVSQLTHNSFSYKYLYKSYYNTDLIHNFHVTETDIGSHCEMKGQRPLKRSVEDGAGVGPCQ